MPKKLQVSSNERVDISDFVRASSDYTQESVNFDRAKLLQARRAVVSSGFRIELSNQGTNPGEITVYNGVAVDRDGNILNNEDQANDSRTLTLAGANSTFYIELEFTEATSDVDSRGFWDPTFSGNNPPGREFNLNVATRLSPDWQVVTPVSTTDFDVATNAGSNRIPLAVLSTNGSNEITGVTLVNAASNLELDAAATDTTFRVLDSTILPDTGSLIIGVGTANQETVNLTANDRANGILTIAPGFVNSHQAGAIVREDGVTAAYVVESEVADPPTGASGDTDRRRGLFKGDEIRGSALVASKEAVGDRDDLALARMKDYVDFLAAQIRELKFGALRSDEIGGIPPSPITDTRYYDPAGSVQGARAQTLTIGDGTLSYGDIISSSADLGTQLQVANAALDPTVGGTIYIKAGNYTVDTSFGFDRPVRLICDKGVNIAAGSGQIDIGDQPVEIEGWPEAANGWVPVVSPSLGFGGTAVNITGMNIILRDSSFRRLDLTGAIASQQSVTCFAERVNVYENSTGAVGSVFANSNTVIRADFKDCTFAYRGASAGSASHVFVSWTSNLYFNNCVFDASESGGGSIAGFFRNISPPVGTGPRDIEFISCRFIDSSGNSAVDVGMDFLDGGGDVENIVIRDCYFDFNFRANPDYNGRVVRITGLQRINDVTIERCNFQQIGVNGIPDTTDADPGAIVEIVSFIESVNVSVINNRFGAPLTQDPTDFVDQVRVDTPLSTDSEDGAVRIENNSFQQFTRGINVVDGNIIVANNNFEFTGNATLASGVEIEAITLSGTATRSAIITGNSISITCSHTGVVDDDYGINMLGTGIPRNFTIADNRIEIDSDTSDCYGISILDLAVEEDFEGTITGNVITLTTDFDASGIRMSLSSSDSEARVTVADNSVTVIADVDNASVDLIGIEMEWSTSSSLASEQAIVVSGNSISLPNSGQDTIEQEGIRFRGKRGICANNNINIEGGDDVTGIAVDGLGQKVTGNKIFMINALLGNYNGRGITLVPTVDAARNNEITNNSIQGTAETLWCIEVDAGATEDISGLKIDGNLIDFLCSTASTNGAIYVDTSNSTDDEARGVKISNNTLIERSFLGAGRASRVGIYAIAAGSLVFGELTISQNTIAGEPLSGASFDRNPGAAAVLVQNPGNNCQITGNNIRWGDAVTDGAGILIIGPGTVGQVSITGNHCHEQAGLQIFTTTSISTVQCHGNYAIGSSAAGLAAVNTAYFTDNVTVL